MTDGPWEPGPESFSEDDRDQTTREQAGYPELSEAQKLAIDMSVTGSAWFDADGKRVPPEDVVVHRRGPRLFTPEQLKQFDLQRGSYTNALSRSALSGKGFLGSAIAATAPGIGSAIHAAMEAEAAKVAGIKGVRGGPIIADEVLDSHVLPETLTQFTRHLLEDWEQETITSAELLTVLDELLDKTLHSKACHIDPDDTTCFCVIGQLRSVLPPCTVEYPLVPGDAKLWHCTRKAHPASPDRHVWSNR